MTTPQPIPSLSSFNPHAVHPFTAGSPNSSPHLHHISSARIPKPSLPTSQPQSTASVPLVSSLPPQTTTHFPAMPVFSPQPRPASNHRDATTSQPIFIPFKLERSSPELSDILVKKTTSLWHVKPTDKSQGANTAGSSIGKK